MPPENNGSGALLSLLAGKSGGSDGASAGLTSLAGNFLGMSSTAAMFVGMVHSRTLEDRIIDKFDLQKVYRARYKQDARRYS